MGYSSLKGKEWRDYKKSLRIKKRLFFKMLSKQSIGKTKRPNIPKKNAVWSRIPSSIY